MRCPFCDLPLANADTAYCPRCGHSLTAAASAASAAGAGPSPLPTALDPWSTPGSANPRGIFADLYGPAQAPGGSDVSGGSGGFATPGQPSMPRPYGAAGPSSGAGFGTLPGYPPYPQAAPPPYPPPYGAPSTTPLYGQYDEHGQYGQYAPYGQYGQGAPPSTPYYGPGGAPAYAPPPFGYGAPPSQVGAPVWLPQPLPERKSPRTAIFAIVGVVLALVVCSVVALAALQLAGPNQNQPASSVAVASVTSQAQASSTASERVLFQDPMTSDQYGWSSGTHCFFAGGKYHVVGGYLCFAPVNDLGDGDITVTAQQVSGDVLHGYGIVFRRTSTGNYYLFQADGNGKWTFGKTVSGTYTTLLDWSADAAVHAGATASNTFKVHAHGTHFEFYINGANIGHTDDSTFTAGLCGVAGNYTGEADFMNFVITVPQ